jgi:hypothetical protein
VVEEEEEEEEDDDDVIVGVPFSVMMDETVLQVSRSGARIKDAAAASLQFDATPSIKQTNNNNDDDDKNDNLDAVVVIIKSFVIIVHNNMVIVVLSLLFFFVIRIGRALLVTKNTRGTTQRTPLNRIRK